MAKCEVCGNEYDKAFTVTPAGGKARTFDSHLTVATQRLALVRDELDDV